MQPRSILLLCLTLLGLLSAVPASADPILVADAFIVDRSTLEANKGAFNGKLTITYNFGRPPNQRSFTVLYTNDANSEEAILGFRRLHAVMRNLDVTEFGDPQMGPMIGLTIDRLLTNQEKQGTPPTR